MRFVYFKKVTKQVKEEAEAEDKKSKGSLGFSSNYQT